MGGLGGGVLGFDEGDEAVNEFDPGAGDWVGLLEGDPGAIGGAGGGWGIEEDTLSQGAGHGGGVEPDEGLAGGGEAGEGAVGLAEGEADHIRGEAGLDAAGADAGLFDDAEGVEECGVLGDTGFGGRGAGGEE